MKVSKAFIEFMNTSIMDLLKEMFEARKWNATVTQDGVEDGSFAVRLPDGRTYEITVVQKDGPDRKFAPYL
jgi:hypothetical protein